MTAITELKNAQDKSLEELELFLKKRIEEAESGEVLNQSVESIFAEVKEESCR